ncbi:MAG: glycosyltransferase family 4 protein, partial [archaeon]|nr:glycosyltransferase family 4 protein [archaeon]
VPSVLSKNPDAKFVFAGAGYMTDRLKRQACDMGLADKILFLGFVDDLTLKKLFHISDMVVVPSRYEPFGITTLEAMACRKPVVVSDTGGLAETVDHDVNGIKVWTESSDSVAWGINRLLADKGLSRKISENAYDTVVNNYTWTNISQRVKKLYENVMEQYYACDWKPAIVAGNQTDSA